MRPTTQSSTAASLIYVEVPKLARGLSLLKAIWTFISCRRYHRVQPLPTTCTPSASSHLPSGCAASSSTTATESVERQPDSRLLADVLKGIITGLPATIVLVGTGFDESGVLLHGSAGDQVRSAERGGSTSGTGSPPARPRSATGRCWAAA